MANETIKFEIVTPEKVVFKEEINQVTVPTTSGEVSILPNHIPLVSVLNPGVIEVKQKDNSLEIMSVSGGFIEVTKNKVTILADSAERAEEIDEQEVEAARAKAEESKKQAQDKDEVDFTEVTAKIEKELARLRAVKKWRKLKNIHDK